MGFVYTNAGRLLNETYWTSTTIKALLVGAGYVPNRDHVNVNAIGANELTGTNYVPGFNGAGRKVLAGKSVTVDFPNNRVLYNAGSPQWPGINAGTARALILLQELTSDADSLLLAYLDGIADKLTNGTTLVGTFPGGQAFRFVL